jgi:hypothetical protein
MDRAACFLQLLGLLAMPLGESLAVDACWADNAEGDGWNRWLNVQIAGLRQERAAEVGRDSRTIPAGVAASDPEPGS